MQVTLDLNRQSRFRKQHGIGMSREGLQGFYTLTHLKMLILCVGIITCCCIMTTVTYADGPSLTKVFTTKAFQGSWEVINKMNWLGWLMNMMIGSFSFIGLCLIFYQRMISLLYLSARGFFDQVYDIKNDNKGKFFGFLSLGKNTFEGSYGTGLDSFIGFFLGLMPNVKKYSDFNPEKMHPKISEDEEALSYILKTAPSSIALIFFFTMGFGGQLGKAYGCVVDGLMSVADHVFSTNLDKYVDKFFAMGNNYDFSVGKDGSDMGTKQLKIAKAIYGDVCSEVNAESTEARAEIGANVERYVQSHLTTDKLNAGFSTNMTDASWDNVDYNVIVNSNQTASSGEFIDPVPITDFASGYQGKDKYVHILLSLDKNADTSYVTPQS